MARSEVRAMLRLGCVVAAVAIVAAACTSGGTTGGATTPSAWTVAAAPGFIGDAIVTADGVLTVGSSSEVGAAHEKPVVWSSADGSAWESRPVAGDGRIASVAKGAGGFVAVGRRVTGSQELGQAWRSADARSWAPARDGSFDPAAGCASTTVADVAAGPAGYAAVGVEWGEGSCGQHAVAWHSADGASWTRATIDDAGNQMGQVVAVPSGYAAAGAANAAAGEGTHAMFWSSPDGRAWTAAKDIAGFAGAEPAALASLPGGTVTAIGMRLATSTALAVQPAAWSSSDGRAWARLDAPGLAWGESAIPSPAAGETVGAMALTSELVPTERGTVALGAGMWARRSTQDQATTATSPWRYLVWVSSGGSAWKAVPDDDALIVGTSPSYVTGPGAAAVVGGRLLVFGARFGSAPEGGPPPRSPMIWSTDLAALWRSTGG